MKQSMKRFRMINYRGVIQGFPLPLYNCVPKDAVVPGEYGSLVEECIGATPKDPCKYGWYGLPTP